MKILIPFLISLSSFFFTSTTYYVTPAGSGSGTGLDSSNTLSYAALYSKTLAYGDVVKFKAGNTYLGQHYAKNGVTYDRYSAGTNPVISGFTTLSTWTLLSGHIYYASISSSQLQGVSLDGTIRAMGRYPNTGYLTYTSHSGNTSITGTTIGALPATYVGGEVAIRKYRYILDRHKITAQSGNTITYSSTNFYGNSSNYDPTDGNGYFVQNHTSTLDQDGEWCYKPDSSRLYMYFAGTPSGRVVKAANVQELVPLNSTVDVTFNNIDFEGANTCLANYGTSNIKLSKCAIRQCGVGVYGADCENFQAKSSTINDSWSNGIFIETGGHNSLIDSVTLNRTALIPGLGQSGDGKYSGIGIVGVKTTVTNTTVKNTGYNAIAVDGDSILVEHNLVDSFCVVKDDGGGLYAYSAPPGTGFSGVRSDRKLRNNIITNAIGAPDGGQSNGDAGGEAAAIYLDGYANHTEVSGNSGAHGPWAGIINHGNSDNQIINNTMYDFTQQMLVIENSLSGLGLVRNLTITGNKFIARTTSQRALWVTFNNGVVDNPVNLGTWNNNTYARPADDSLTIALFKPNSGFYQDMTLATWKSSYSQDAASVKSSVTTTDVNNLSFVYNYSGSGSNLTLPGVYRDVANVSYPGLIILPAYSSSLLIYNSLLPTGFIIIRAGPYKFTKQ